MTNPNDDLRAEDRRRFTLAVFRMIALGRGFLGTKPWPSFRCWVPRPRTHLPECMEKPRRKRPLGLKHGPIICGVLQPIRKSWNPLKNRYVTNEV